VTSDPDSVIVGADVDTVQQNNKPSCNKFPAESFTRQQNQILANFLAFCTTIKSFSSCHCSFGVSGITYIKYGGYILNTEYRV